MRIGLQACAPRVVIGLQARTPRVAAGLQARAPRVAGLAAEQEAQLGVPLDELGEVHLVRVRGSGSGQG